jgi:hypothetical protein
MEMKWLGRTKITARNTEGMVWEIALILSLEPHFCHEKRPSKKKVTCGLRGTSPALALPFLTMKMAV